MLLHIEPCMAVVKCKEHQCFIKLNEELAEIQKAVIDYETGTRLEDTPGARESLKEHIAEEIIDLMTAAATLGKLYDLDLEKACEEVIAKNMARNYIKEVHL